MAEELHEGPQEFFQEHFSNRGFCDAQAVLPLEDGSYRAYCTCEEWETVTDSREDGLRQAVEHTQPVTDRELAKRAAREKEAATAG